MALTQAQKVSIRRHLGVPFAGTAQAGRLYGWRFTWYQEDLEYRMNNMQPSEEALITGNALGLVRIYPRVTAGDVISYTLVDGVNNLAAAYTVQASDLALQPGVVNPADSSPLYAAALGSAAALNTVLIPKGYAAVGVMPADLYSPQYVPPFFAEVDIMGPGSSTFTLTVSVAGTTNAQIGQQGLPSPVVATLVNTITKQQTIAYGYANLLDALAMGMTQANLSLWLERADVAKFRVDEIAARRALYREYITQLEMVLGSREYVQKFGGAAAGGASA